MEKTKEQMYMHINTGSVDPYNGWFYEETNEEGIPTGKILNAVDREEVVEVSWNKTKEQWEEV